MKIDDKKIQEFWEKNKVFKTENNKNKKKFYCLDMFPYPSGDGLHVGHIKGYTATDIISRFMKMNGYNVLHPMGWDAFGLPAENYALKVGKSPQDAVKNNIARFKEQLQTLGFCYDWSREINTTDPEYYKWTQWIFLKLFKKGLAYEDDSPINFCPSCKTGLANEEVTGGLCERCGTKVEKKKIRQWILKITDYAEKLLRDLDDLDWPEPIKQMQRNWIGKSEGTQIEFRLVDEKSKDIGKITVFTTRADTLFGCTYIVLSPEHKQIAKLGNYFKNINEVDYYIKEAGNKSDLERTDLAKEKTGVCCEGIWAINPINNEKLPVWIADYVLANYGTGAIMAVPAHDERDFEFAKKYSIKIAKVINPTDQLDSDKINELFCDYGVLANSEKFTGLTSEEAKKKITEKLKSINAGDFAVSYKLRDWVFSRQRYWGEPIPLIHCEKCGTVAVEEKDLPVLLPEIEKYEPSGTGESPLAKITQWVETECPRCGGKAKRETNTMPQWAGSCWYYLRYIDPNNKSQLCGKDEEEHFMPVDLYIGGAEHAVLHLLYARFWHKVLYEEGIVSTKEPFQKLQNVGLILAPDRQKMSKSRGNVISPDTIVNQYGIDALKVYEMFIGPFNQPAIFNTNGLIGVKKFLDKVTNSFEQRSKKNNNDIEFKLSELVNSTANKIEKMQFNTVVSDFMKFANEIDLCDLSDEQWKIFLQTLAPFAPHTCETLWLELGNQDSIFNSTWPKTEYKGTRQTQYIIQINGKKTTLMNLDFDLKETTAIEIAKKNEKVRNSLDSKQIKKTIFVKDKIINFVL